jgi:hypothetical protein
MISFDSDPKLPRKAKFIFFLSLFSVGLDDADFAFCSAQKLPNIHAFIVALSKLQECLAQPMRLFTVVCVVVCRGIASLPSLRPPSLPPSQSPHLYSKGGIHNTRCSRHIFSKKETAYM